MNSIIQKKGQVTLFIVIGLILLLMIGIYFYISSIKPSEEKITPDLEPIKIFVDTCLEQTAVPAVLLQASQSGYLYLPENNGKPNYAETDSGNIPYGFVGDKKQLLSKESMEKQLNTYLAQEILKCINSFKSIPGKKIEVEEESAVVTSSIDRNIIRITFNYPITLDVKGDGTQLEKLEEFSTDIPLRLGHVVEIIHKILDSQEEDSQYLDLELLNSFDVKVDVIPLNDEDMLFQITDKKDWDKGTEGVYELEEDYLVFLTAAKYAVNYPPKMTLQEGYLLKDEQEFVLEIPYHSDDNIVFEDDTPLFDIEYDGSNKGKAVIKFTPSVEGEFPVRITITDTIGQSVEQEVMFKVVG